MSADPKSHDDPSAGAGVPALVAIDSPTMRLPRRYWTIVVHRAAYDVDHEEPHYGFEMYDEDGRVAYRRGSDGWTSEIETFLDGVAAGRDDQIAVRRVDVSDVTGYGFDGLPDQSPVVREDWYSVEPYESS